MISNTKDPDKCKMVDMTRIKRYASYYIRQNRGRTLSGFVANARAPIEHLFNDHMRCDSAWCWAKEASDKKEKVMKEIANKCVDVLSSDLVQSKDKDAETQTVNLHQQVDPVILDNIVLDTSDDDS